MAKYKGVREEIEHLSVSATSQDRSITVTVGPGGAVQDIEFQQQALRLGPERLASTLITMIRTATVQVNQQMADLVQPLAPSGVDVMDMVNAHLPDIELEDPEEHPREILNKIKSVEKLLADAPKGKAITPERPPSLSEAGPIRFDALEDMPVISSLGKGVQKAFEEKDFADLASFTGDALGSALGLAGFAPLRMDASPMTFLASWGLTFLIDVIQPLEDALAYVTGHPEKIDDASNQWEVVGQKLEELSKKVLEIPRR
ncbi:hypothetical protein GCM10022254_28730 [Actinomadura meridiana]|uniref:Uncharacterized protein n=2 Tax=Actinomadura meridiana TaxID=559626 RepID=A0ABP8C0J6_9ACTN